MKTSKKKGKRFNFKNEPIKLVFTLIGVIAIILGIFIVIPVLLPLIKLVLGVILIVTGYFVIQKNSNLFRF